MAEEQKPAEVPKDIAVTEPAAETKAEEVKPAETAEATTATEGASAEETKKEVTPVEEGHLEHKKAGKFPGNILYSKQHFWFGSDALEKSGLSNLLKGADSHHNAAWASHTGKGLLFFGDKSTPSGVINLNDANEPASDGMLKFHFTSKGQKHTFKAATMADRDNWVAQLKVKIAEAKALAESIPESEAYKTALESFKPAPPAKEEKPAEAAKEEPPKEEPAKEEAPKEEAKKEEEPAKEEAKEDTKRRSASRKRASIMGFLGKKDKKEEKKEEEATEAPKDDAPAEAAAEPAAAAPAAEDKPAEEAAPAEDKPAEAKEAPKEKPATSKRNSFFGLLQKGRRSESAEAAPPAPAKDETPATTEAAPVIPPVEATTPLAVDVASPATVPTETREVAPATNGDTVTKTKSERRKSSIPFLTKKEKSAVSDEDGEKQGPFSKLRATIRGRKEKAEKAAEEKPAEDKAAEEKPAVTTSEPATEAPKPAEEPVKPEAITTTTPAVTAAA